MDGKNRRIHERPKKWPRSFWSQKSDSKEHLSPSNIQKAERQRSRSPIQWFIKNGESSLQRIVSRTVFAGTPESPSLSVVRQITTGALVPASTPVFPSPLNAIHSDAGAEASTPPPTSQAANHVAGTTSTNSPSLWQKSLDRAQEKLLEKQLPPLDQSHHESKSAGEIVRSTVDELQNIVKITQDNGKLPVSCNNCKQS
ncbi:hypothetical protein BDZ91DRAFT_358332 [Kalaharituber pfeilii]|nr:hypothetical protein BDZ91DRAFT_358332 [Kalaharituber pfeilii]